MNDIFRPLFLRGDWLMEIGGKEFSLPILAASLLSEFIGLPLCFVGAETFGIGQTGAGLSYWAAGLAFALFGLVLPFAGKRIQATVGGWVSWTFERWRAICVGIAVLAWIFLAVQMWALKSDFDTYARPRQVTPSQAAKIASALRSKRHNFTLGIVSYLRDEEGNEFAGEIYNAVKNGGWDVLAPMHWQQLDPLPPPPLLQEYATKADFDAAVAEYIGELRARNAALKRMPPEPVSNGLCTAWIGTDDRPPATIGDPQSPETILTSVFSDVGIPFNCGQGAGNQNSRNTLYVLVGHRPRALYQGLPWLWWLGEKLQQMSLQ